MPLTHIFVLLYQLGIVGVALSQEPGVGVVQGSFAFRHDLQVLRIILTVVHIDVGRELLSAFVRILTDVEGDGTSVDDTTAALHDRACYRIIKRVVVDIASRLSRAAGDIEQIIEDVRGPYGDLLLLRELAVHPVGELVFEP